VKKRLKLATRSTVKMLSRLDDGSMPAPPERPPTEEMRAAAQKAAEDARKKEAAEAEALRRAEEKENQKRAEASARAAKRAAREEKARRDAEAKALAAGRVGRLVVVRGTVTLERASLGAQAAAEGPLFIGDLLVTGIDGAAVLRTEDGREIELGPQTRFLVDRRLGRVTLNLQAGTIEILDSGADAGRQGQVTLTLLTPYGESELVAGTKATVSVGASGLSVDVELGAIQLVAEDGGQRTIASGKQMRVSVGAIELQPPEEPDAGPVVAAANPAPPAVTPIAPEPVAEEVPVVPIAVGAGAAVGVAVLVLIRLRRKPIKPPSA
jgi:ferric-dicitrate binding protein FerR (iron transport regulator)